MDLSYEFTFNGLLDKPQMVGAGPYGTRAFFPVTGGRAEGDRIKGTLLGGGGDWILLGADGWGRVDVRAQIRTDDGAVIYASYQGLMELNEAVMAASADPELGTGFDDQYFRTTPRLETGDERYGWVNQTLFVARGRLIAGGVEYEVYRLT